MSEPVARSWRLTRRTLGATLLAATGLAAARTWPGWAFWRVGSAGLAGLAGLPQSATLRALGNRIRATGAVESGDAAALNDRLAGGYDAAVARDLADGRLVSIDGWLVPETQALAAVWLASAA